MTALLPPPTVRLVVCGNADRGDDGVALAAAATLLPSLPSELAPKLEVRRCPELRTEDLIDLPDGMQVLIIDAVIGLSPGDIVRMPLGKLVAHPAFTPRSSHQLPIDLVVGLAGVIRRHPIPGTFVGLSGHRFGYGTPLSRAARAGLPVFRDAIVEELAHLAGTTAICPQTTVSDAATAPAPTVVRTARRPARAHPADA